MIPEKILNSLYCAFSTNNHFLEHPLALSCGHSACLKCFETKNDNKCLRCGKENINQIDNQSLENDLAKNAIEAYIEDLFQILEKKFKDGMNSFQSILFKLN